MPPGEYLAVAFVEPSLREIDPALIDALLPVATRVVLWPRTPRDVTLTVQKR